MTTGVAGNIEAAAGGLRDRLRGCLFRRSARGGRCQRHLVCHLRHVGAEADQDGGNNHQVTHYATLDCQTADNTTPGPKPRLTEAAILTKRMSEVLTGGALQPRPPAGRGRIALAIRVRGYRSIERYQLAERAPHPSPLPARAGRGISKP